MITGLPENYAIYDPSYPIKKTLLEAAADVANSLDQTVQKVIKFSPKAKRKVETNEVSNFFCTVLMECHVGFGLGIIDPT